MCCLPPDELMPLHWLLSIACLAWASVAASMLLLSRSHCCRFSVPPQVDNFELAKQQLKLETEGEKRVDAAYQVGWCGQACMGALLAGVHGSCVVERPASSAASCAVRRVALFAFFCTCSWAAS